MVTSTDPRPVLRQELARVFKNQRVIRAFEKIFDLIPPEFINQQVQLDTLSLIAELGASQSTEAIASVMRLSAAIEQLALSPPSVDQLLSDDLTPRAELADLKAISVEAKVIDNTTNLITSSVTMTNGAAVAGGTLLNAPIAGNPTKWVPVDDNGTIRFAPLW